MSAPVLVRVLLHKQGEGGDIIVGFNITIEGELYTSKVRKKKLKTKSLCV
jgi:hypothetical protein